MYSTDLADISDLAAINLSSGGPTMFTGFKGVLQGSLIGIPLQQVGFLITSGQPETEIVKAADKASTWLRNNLV